MLDDHKNDMSDHDEEMFAFFEISPNHFRNIIESRKQNLELKKTGITDEQEITRIIGIQVKLSELEMKTLQQMRFDFESFSEKGTIFEVNKYGIRDELLHAFDDEVNTIDLEIAELVTRLKDAEIRQASNELDKKLAALSINSNDPSLKSLKYYQDAHKAFRNQLNAEQDKLNLLALEYADPFSKQRKSVRSSLEALDKNIQKITDLVKDFQDYKQESGVIVKYHQKKFMELAEKIKTATAKIESQIPSYITERTAVLSDANALEPQKIKALNELIDKYTAFMGMGDDSPFLQPIQNSINDFDKLFVIQNKKVSLDPKVLQAQSDQENLQVRSKALGKEIDKLTESINDDTVKLTKEMTQLDDTLKNYNKVIKDLNRMTDAINQKLSQTNLENIYKDIADNNLVSRNTINEVKSSIELANMLKNWIQNQTIQLGSPSEAHSYSLKMMTSNRGERSELKEDKDPISQIKDKIKKNESVQIGDVDAAITALKTNIDKQVELIKVNNDIRVVENTQRDILMQVKELVLDQLLTTWSMQQGTAPYMADNKKILLPEKIAAIANELKNWEENYNDFEKPLNFAKFQNNLRNIMQRESKEENVSAYTQRVYDYLNKIIQSPLKSYEDYEKLRNETPTDLQIKINPQTELQQAQVQLYNLYKTIILQNLASYKKDNGPEVIYKGGRHKVSKRIAGVANEMITIEQQEKEKSKPIPAVEKLERILGREPGEKGTFHGSRPYSFWGRTAESSSVLTLLENLHNADTNNLKEVNKLIAQADETLNNLHSKNQVEPPKLT